MLILSITRRATFSLTRHASFAPLEYPKMKRKQRRTRKVLPFYLSRRFCSSDHRKPGTFEYTAEGEWKGVTDNPTAIKFLTGKYWVPLHAFMGLLLGHEMAHGFYHWSVVILMMYNGFVAASQMPVAIENGYLSYQDMSYLLFFTLLILGFLIGFLFPNEQVGYDTELSRDLEDKTKQIAKQKRLPSRIGMEHAKGQKIRDDFRHDTSD